MKYQKSVKLFWVVAIACAFTTVEGYTFKKNKPLAKKVNVTIQSKECDEGVLDTAEEEPYCAENCVAGPRSCFQYGVGDDFSVGGEFLYWIAQESGLEYAQGGLSPDPADVLPVFDGKMYAVKPIWDSGFRVFVGYNIPGDCWDVQSGWTEFHTKASNSVTGNLEPLWGTFNAALTEGDVSRAKAAWTLHYDQIRLDIGRSFWIGQYFSLRPTVGLSYLILEQTLKVNYTLNSNLPFTTTNAKAHVECQGGGIRVGIDTLVSNCIGFGMYGRGAVNFYYNHISSDYNALADGSSIGNSHQHYWRGMAQGELALGLRWDGYFGHNGRCHFGFWVGVEQNILFEGNQMQHWYYLLQSGISKKDGGNLTLQGGTAGMRLDF